MPKKTKTSLEDYVKAKIKSLEDSARNGAKSYSDWLRATGESPEEDYKSAIRNIYRNAHLKTYGQALEENRERGLSISGYEKYLKEKAASVLAKEKDAARLSYVQKTGDALAGYRDYVAGLLDKSKKNYESALSAIQKANTLNTEDAYAIAISKGLDEELATEASRIATEANRRKIYDKVTEEIMRKNLTSDEAREYARSLGLSESDANTLSDYAHKMNELLTTGKSPPAKISQPQKLTK